MFPGNNVLHTPTVTLPVTYPGYSGTFLSYVDPGHRLGRERRRPVTRARAIAAACCALLPRSWRSAARARDRPSAAPARERPAELGRMAARAP